MQIDIYLREKKAANDRRGNLSKARSIRIPILPEQIKFESGKTTFVNYDIMNRGEVAVPTGTELSAYSWESEFPGQFRKDSSLLRGSWKPPKEYHDILEDWKAKGTKINLMVTGYPINTDVYVESYTGAGAGAFGDIAYELTLIEARDLTLLSPTKESKPTIRRAAKKTNTYTIKSGDTLWAISKKFYGSGSKWQKIYNANKNIIEKTAKARWKAAGINRDSQNGHWIFPGVKLTIPD